MPPWFRSRPPPAPPLPDPALIEIRRLVQLLTVKVTTMSASISDQITALTAKFSADFDAITTEVGGFQQQIATLTAELQPGATITQPQVDALAALEKRAAAIAATPTPTPAAPAA